MTAWDEPDGQRACKIKGPVDWEEPNARFRMVRRDGASWIERWWKGDEEPWAHARPITDHEAACLHRDHARRWLEQHDQALLYRHLYPYGTDEELIAAILAVGKD